MKKPKTFKPTLSNAKTFSAQAIDNLYSHQWEKYRMLFLAENRRCYLCNDAATVVDHLCPHKGEFNLFWKRDNYIPLCKRHHDTATQLFDRNFRKGGSIDSKLTWMKWQRAAAEVSHKVRLVPFPDDLKAWLMEKRMAASKIY